MQLSWVRRTRASADSWNLDEVPLGEEREAYAVDILSGTTVVRTLSAATPTVLYAAADELTDFGAPQTSIKMSVSQLSASVGRGFAAQAVLAV